MHARTQIRNAVVTALTGLTTTGANVAAGRVYPSTAPSISVYTPTERRIDAMATMDSTDPPEPRQLSILIEIRAKTTGDILAALDAIEVEVVAALYADETLGGLVEYLDMDAVAQSTDGESDQSVGLSQITFTTAYRIAGNDPETVIH